MSANKAKGTSYESALVRTLAELFAGRFGLAPRTGTTTLNSVSTNNAAVVHRMITALQEA